ncbi:hypothetical protein CL619_02885 [archaeon]|nr:hypothetical protein [archaeon]|tara:strand:+ start:3291 stop:4295 length:1005 start_codon:yes stop_codon:yes gene_type:complete
MNTRSDLSVLRESGQTRLNYWSTLEIAATELFFDEDPKEVVKVLDEIIWAYVAEEFNYLEALQADIDVDQKIFPVTVAASIFELDGNHNKAAAMYKQIGRSLARRDFDFGWQQEPVTISLWGPSASADPSSLVLDAIYTSVRDIEKVYDRAVKRGLTKSSPINFDVVKQAYAKIRKDTGRNFSGDFLRNESAVRIVLSRGLSPELKDLPVANYLRRMFWVPQRREKVNEAFAKRVSWHLSNPQFSPGKDDLTTMTQGKYFIANGSLLSEDDYQRLADMAIGLSGLLLDQSGDNGLQTRAGIAFEDYGRKRSRALDDYLNNCSGPDYGFNSIVDF